MAKQHKSKQQKKEKSKSTATRYKNNYEGTLTLIVPAQGIKQASLQQELKGFMQAWGERPLQIIVAPVGELSFELEELATETASLQYLPSSASRGAAIGLALKQCTGDHVLLTDGKMNAGLDNLLKWVNNTEGHDLPADKIWVGSRRHVESKNKGKQGMLMPILFNGLSQIFSNHNLLDTGAQFYLMPTAMAKGLYLANPKATDLEMLSQASLRNIELEEKPIEWKINVALDRDGQAYAKKGLALLQSRWGLRFRHFFISPLKELKNKSLFPNQENPLFRFLFAISSLAILFMMVMMSGDYGITGDEVLQKVYGDNVLAYFESNGEDRNFMKQNNVHYYGGLFDYFASWLNKYVGGLDEYDMRHLLNAIFGFFAIFFAARIGRLVSGSWRVALLTLLFVALSPRFFGHSMNNPKDIPFATGYLIAIYYMLQLAKQLPRVNAKTIIMAIVGIGMTINMRSGGIILIPYLGVFMAGAVLFRPELRPVLFKFQLVPLAKMLAVFVLITLLGYYSGTWFWPYAQEDVWNHPFEALGEMTNFATGIRMLWGGEHLWSDQLPWYYIPQWLFISSPIVVLLGIPLSLAFFMKPPYKKTWLYFGMAMFTAIFPVAYAIYKDSALYDGMRHFLFIYPLLAFAAAYGWVILADILQKRVLQIVVAAAVGLMLLLPLRWMVVSHPYQYAYFNEFFGGIKNAYGKYETDYWMTSMREMSKWLMENEPRVKGGQELIIATNCHKPVAHYFSKYPNVKVRYARYHERVKTEYEYFLSYSRFINHGFIESEAWPPGKVIHLEMVDGVPLGAITKNENGNKKGAAAQAAFKAKEVAKGCALLEEILEEDPKNESAMLLLTQMYPQVKQLDKMKAVLDKMYALSDDYVNGLGMRGVYFVNMNQRDSAVQIFQRAVDLNFKYTFGYYYLGLLTAQENKNPALALDYFLKFDEFGGQPSQGYQNAMAFARQTGSRKHELYFQAKLLAARGNHNEAYKMVGQCLGVDPMFEPAKKMKDQYLKANKNAEKERKMVEKIKKRNRRKR